MTRPTITQLSEDRAQMDAIRAHAERHQRFLGYMKIMGQPVRNETVWAFAWGVGAFAAIAAGAMIIPAVVMYVTASVN